MPYVGDGTVSSPEVSVRSTETDAMAVQSTNRGSWNPLTSLAGYAVGGVVDLADTIASSVPGVSHVTGMERGDLNMRTLRALDWSGANQFYAENKEGIEVASGIAGVIASEVAARRVTAPASLFMGALRKTPYLRRLAVLDEQYAAAMSTMAAVDSSIATRGIMGTSQYTARAVVDGTRYDAATGAMVNASINTTRNSARKTAWGLGAAVGARNALATEAIMGITLNQNGFLYDDSAAYNLAFGALGATAGAVFEGVNAAYRIRKFANSDLIRRKFANALDPDMVEEGRLTWMGKAIGRSELQPGDFLGGTYTDKVSDLMVNASKLRELPATGTDDPTTLLAQRASLAQQHVVVAREEMQKVTTKGVSTDGRTRFSMDAPGYGNHADMMIYRDPLAMNGVEMLGGVPQELSSRVVADTHAKRLEARLLETHGKIDSLTKEMADKGKSNPKAQKQIEQLQKLAKRLTYEKSLTPKVAIDGEWMPLSEAEAFEGFVEPQLKFNPLTNSDLPKGSVAGVWETVSDVAHAKVTLDHELTLHLPGNKTLDNADHYDVMRAYRLADRAIDRLAGAGQAITLPAKPSWFQLDMAEEILKRSNGNANITWPAGMTRESAQVESLVQKAEALKLQRGQEVLNARKADKAGSTYEGRMSRLRMRYNLPRLTAYERGVMGTAEHPIELLMRGITEYSPDAVRQMPLGDVIDGVGKAKRLGEEAPVSRADLKQLYGSSFKFMMDEKGNPIKPLLAYQRAPQQVDWTADALAERLAARKMRTMTTLTDERADPLSKNLTAAILNSEDFHLASRTDQLMDTQIQGNFMGAAPQTPFGALPKALMTTEWTFRDTPIVLAAGRLRDTSSRIMRDYMKRSIESAFGDSLQLLANPRNASSKLLLEQFHNFRSGWDLEKKMVDRGDGFFGFRLGDTEKNRTMWKSIHGDEEFKKGTPLRSPDGKEVVLDQLGVRIQGAFNQVTGELIDAKNTLLRSLGRGEINQANHFVPSPDTNGKFIGFVLDPNNKVVPHMTVVEDTAEGFAKSKAEVMKRLDGMGKGGMGYLFRTQDEIRRFATIWDKAEMSMINPGTTAVQPGKRGAGKLVGPQIKLDAFEDSMKYLRDQYMQHGGDIVETLMKEQINSAKARANIASEVSRNKEQTTKYRSIYDFYLENLQGTSKLNSEGSFIGKIFNPIEKMLDAGLEQATPSTSRVWGATTEWLARHKIWDSSEQGRKDFESLSKHLGQYMPFEDAAHLAERKAAGAIPVTTKEITGKINQVTAAVMLRIAEVAHPIMNLGGIINAMPAVVRSFQPRAGESAEDFAARIGHSAQLFKVGDETVAVPDIIKMARRSFGQAWSRESHQDYAFMVQRGYLSQEVAEFQRQFGAIESHGKLREFAGKSVDWLSTLSDKSEDFSRSWGHMIGLQLADSLGVTGRESRHMFAHDIANKMIANYDPHNRPEIFQGALGAPLGLFQSFAQNYYQRLFRYIETKDYRTAAVQYATQSALFGVTGLTGWNEMNSMVSMLTGGEDDADTGIHGRFNNTFGDILAHGTLSNIPRLFGAAAGMVGLDVDTPAVDLYSRGDTGVRIPGVGSQPLPGVSVGLKVAEGLGQGLGLFKAAMMDNGTQLSRTQMAEIASNMVVNRPIAGMIEQFLANGNDTDAYGQLVNNTKGWAETTYRLMGLRSMRQSEAVAAFYGDKTAMEHKAAADDKLRVMTRAAMRGGNDEMLPSIFQTYLDNGGDPRQFRKWMRQNYVAATETRSERSLDKLMNSKNPDMERIARYLDMGVGIDEDEKIGDVNEAYGNGPDPLDQTTDTEGQYPNQMTLPQ